MCLIETHIDEHINLCILLLLEDRVCCTDEIRLRLKMIDLLEWEVRLKECAGTKDVERQAEIPQDRALVA